MLALGQSRFGAGRRYRHVDHFGVPGCGNGLLCDQNFTADRTMLALGQSRFGTGGSNRLVNDFGVSVCRNDLLCDQNFVANRTVFAFCQSCFGAGGSNCRVNNFGVSFFGDRFGFGLIASCAGAMLATCFGTGRLGVNDPCTECMGMYGCFWFGGGFFGRCGWCFAFTEKVACGEK